MSRNQPNNPAMGQKSTNAGASQTPRPGIPNPASQSFFPSQPAGGNQTQRPAATNSPPQPPTLAPMSVTDMRGQILANALVVFPHIVSSHNEGFSSVPPRAQDIFEVSISLRHDYYQPDFIARLDTSPCACACPPRPSAGQCPDANTRTRTTFSPEHYLYHARHGPGDHDRATIGR